MYDLLNYPGLYRKIAYTWIREGERRSLYSLRIDQKNRYTG